MKRRWFTIAGCICLALAVGVFAYAWIGREQPSTQTGEFGPVNTTSSATGTTVSTPKTQESSPATEPYVSPVDFESLQAINPDIYAWIEVSGADIHYPVVQSPTDDTFYVNHDSDQKSNINGAIFSEHMYNSLDFTDKVTVLYGHNMKSGAMFGELQSVYWNEEYLRENGDIVIYLPDREIHFEMFAALPYSRMHLLHYYQTEKQRAFDLLIEDIYSSRQLNAVLLEDKKPQFGDQVIVLSTCLTGNNRYRYLVFGVCKASSEY